jgi:hypothetical protein
MHDKRVKDKRICPGGIFFLAVVEYFQDTPARDGHVAVEGLFETLVLAQKFLVTFPRDVWDGYGVTDFNYGEVDKNDQKRDTNPSGTTRRRIRPEHTRLSQFGRTFVRSD